MRIDDLKTWLLANLPAYIAARSTTAVPLTDFDDTSIILREWSEPTKGKVLFLDPQEDEIEPGTNYTDYVTERVKAYVIVTRGATEAVMRNQAAQYLAAVKDCVKHHPDYMRIEGREHYDGVEGKDDQKGSETMLVFEYEE